ncbi:MAG: DUF4398 domain-containing protein [Steroidobacteraceae bacterium]
MTTLLRRWILLLTTTGLAAVLTACTVAPVQEMSDARQAVEAAVRAGGDGKAAQSLQEARSALAQAETALKKAQYRLARQLALQARTKAIEAQHPGE